MTTDNKRYYISNQNKMADMKCTGCGSAVGRSVWLDDGGVFCRVCAQIKRIEYTRRNLLREEAKENEGV